MVLLAFMLGMVDNRRSCGAAPARTAVGVMAGLTAAAQLFVIRMQWCDGQVRHTRGSAGSRSWDGPTQPGVEPVAGKGGLAGGGPDSSVRNSDGPGLNPHQAGRFAGFRLGQAKALRLLATPLPHWLHNPWNVNRFIAMFLILICACDERCYSNPCVDGSCDKAAAANVTYDLSNGSLSGRRSKAPGASASGSSSSDQMDVVPSDVLAGLAGVLLWLGTLEVCLVLCLCVVCCLVFCGSAVWFSVCSEWLGCLVLCDSAVSPCVVVLWGVGSAVSSCVLALLSRLGWLCCGKSARAVPCNVDAACGPRRE